MAGAHRLWWRVLAGWQSGRFPFRISILQPSCPIATLTEQGDCLEREDAPWAAAIRDDLLIPRQFGQAPFQLSHWNIQRFGQVAIGEFVLRADIEDGRRPERVRSDLRADIEDGRRPERVRSERPRALTAPAVTVH
jgi:hypothetical protein